MGLAVVLQVLPHTFIGPVAGVLNDRISRKTVMIGADLARAAIVACMLLVRTPELVWLVYPLLLLETLGAAFFEPARNAVIPNITSRETVIAANTLASTTWSFNLAVGLDVLGLEAAQRLEILGEDPERPAVPASEEVGVQIRHWLGTHTSDYRAVSLAP